MILKYYWINNVNYSIKNVYIFRYYGPIRRLMTLKIKEWIRRYFPPFLVATIFTLLCSNLGRVFELDGIVIAYLGSWGGIISYYLYISIREVIRKHRENRIKIKSFFKIMRNLIFEFSPAEILDILLIGPLCLFIFPKLISNFQMAIIIGKLCADLFFYSTTITFYEIRKKIWH